MAAIGSESKKKIVEGSMLSAGVLLAALLLAFVNYFGWKYHRRFDWTKASLYSLSEKTKNVLRGLDRDVEVVVFTSPEAQLAAEVEEILARYDALSERLSVRTVDPSKNLAEAERLLEQYGTRYDPRGVKVVFSAGSDRRIFDGDQLAEMDFSSLQFGGTPQIESFKGEEVFTGALVDLASGERPQVLFTTGHGEKQTSDFSGRGLNAARELLERNNLEIEEWASLGKPELPAGTDLVVVAGPTTSFVAPELAAFDRFLAQGGRMLWLLDPSLSPAGGLVDLGLAPWLAGYGVRLKDDLVIDPPNTVPFFSDDTFYLASYGDHPVCRALREGELRVILALARSVGRAPEGGSGFEVTELLLTGADGWGETDLATLSGVAKGEADLAGPVPVAVAVEKAGAAGAAESEEGTGESGADAESARAAEAAAKPSGSGMRMVVVGDSDFASDGLVASAANPILLDNAFNWLLARESLLGIPPKRPEQVRLNLTDAQLLAIYLFVALLPLAAIGGGIGVYLKRRR